MTQLFTVEDLYLHRRVNSLHCVAGLDRAVCSARFAVAEFSAADVQRSFPLEAAVEHAGLDASRPRLMGLLERIHHRPAYRRAVERGGPYRFAG